jgi:hypothetical protein
VVALSVVLVVCLGMKQPPSERLATALQLKIVVANPNFETLAVDNRGIAYGKSVRQNDATTKWLLYRSTNEG